jgi:hypothetical protein
MAAPVLPRSYALPPGLVVGALAAWPLYQLHEAGNRLPLGLHDALDPFAIIGHALFIGLAFALLWEGAVLLLARGRLPDVAHADSSAWSRRAVGQAMAMVGLNHSAAEYRRACEDCRVYLDAQLTTRWLWYYGAALVPMLFGLHAALRNLDLTSSPLSRELMLPFSIGFVETVALELVAWRLRLRWATLLHAWLLVAVSAETRATAAPARAAQPAAPAPRPYAATEPGEAAPPAALAERVAAVDPPEPWGGVILPVRPVGNGAPLGEPEPEPPPPEPPQAEPAGPGLAQKLGGQVRPPASSKRRKFGEDDE